MASAPHLPEAGKYGPRLCGPPAPIPSFLCEYATACLLSFRLLPVEKWDPVRPGDDKVKESLHRGHKRLSSRRALATMSVIASTGAMLLSGHKKHQWEVGLSLPNVILVTRWHFRVAPYKFLIPVIAPKARSTAFIEPASMDSPCQSLTRNLPRRTLDQAVWASASVNWKPSWAT